MRELFSTGVRRRGRSLKTSMRLARRLLALASLVLLSAAGPASAAEELRIGTLAPRDSVWGKVFTAWSASVLQESGGALKLSFYFAGSQGDEPTLVGKVRRKELDGAALGGTGLSAFAPSVAVLELPGLFGSWTKLDKGRNALRAALDEEFEKGGVRLLAEGELGTARLFSREKPVHTPDDLRRMHPFLLSGDVIGKAFLDSLGLRPPSIVVQQILPALLPEPRAPAPGAARIPHVDVLFTTALVLSALRLEDLIEYVNPQPTGYSVGGIVVGAGRFAALPPEARAILRRTALSASSLLSQRVRAADDLAYQRLRTEKKVVDLTDAQRVEWAAASLRLRLALRSSLRADLVDAAVAAAQ